MVQVAWLLLLILKEVFGVDTGPMAQLLSVVFQAMGLQ